LAIDGDQVWDVTDRRDLDLLLAGIQYVAGGDTDALACGNPDV
jgi:hypothetical protein